MVHKERIWELVARRLAGEITTTEQRELEELLEAHPDLHFSIDLILSEWKLSGEKEQISEEEYFNRHIQRLQLYRAIEKPLSRNHYIYLSSALILVLVIAGWLWILKGNNPADTPNVQNPQLSFTVPSGKRWNQTLPDGTQIWLNSGSEFTYADDGKARIVHLKGEGFFNVAKDENHPFLIHTPSMTVRVTGTSFNLKAYPQDPTEEMSLISGSVKIKPKASSEEIQLKPTEKLILKKDAASGKISVNDGMVISEQNLLVMTHINLLEEDSSVLETEWIKNRLVFEDESLEDLVTKFKRWYGVTILVMKDDLKSKRFTGNFEQENVHQAIQALKITGGFDYSSRNDTIWIY